MVRTAECHSHPVSHSQVLVSKCSQPWNTLDGRAHWRFQLFQAKLSRLLASSLFVCFGIKHTENKTGPANPARLVPEPAGENIVIGWVSGGPIVRVPGAGWGAGCRRPSTHPQKALALCTSLWFQNNPSHPKQMLVFIQLPAHPLSPQQCWEIHRASVFIQALSSEGRLRFRDMGLRCCPRTLVLRSLPGGALGSTMLTATEKFITLVVLRTRRLLRHAGPHREAQGGSGGRRSWGRCGQAPGLGFLWKQVRQGEQAQVGEFEEFQQALGAGVSCLSRGGEPPGRGEGGVGSASIGLHVKLCSWVSSVPSPGIANPGRAVSLQSARSQIPEHQNYRKEGMLSKKDQKIHFTKS